MQRSRASRAEAETPWRDGTTRLVMSPLAFMQIHINGRCAAADMRSPMASSHHAVPVTEERS
jgi:hypothetical protein